jgi:GNAT superfamily N-acetyltransferase
VSDGAQLTIRPAERRDLPAVVALLAEDKLGSLRERVEEPLADCYLRAFESMAADPNNRQIVAELDGQVIGCLQLTFIVGLSRRGATRAQIEGVRVARALRGKGIGRRLFEWAIAEARAQGCHLVQLTTDKRRADAHGFYESLGFVASHEGMKLQL